MSSETAQVDVAHVLNVANRLNDQRKDEGGNCDIFLCVNGKNLPVHSCVLSAASPYFKGIIDAERAKNPFVQQAGELRKIDMDLPAVRNTGAGRGKGTAGQLAALQDILTYVYTGKVVLRKAGLALLTKMSDAFGLTSLSATLKAHSSGKPLPANIQETEVARPAAPVRRRRTGRNRRVEETGSDRGGPFGDYYDGDCGGQDNDDGSDESSPSYEDDSGNNDNEFVGGGSSGIGGADNGSNDSFVIANLNPPMTSSANTDVWVPPPPLHESYLNPPVLEGFPTAAFLSASVEECGGPDPNGGDNSGFINLDPQDTLVSVGKEMPPAAVAPLNATAHPPAVETGSGDVAAAAAQSPQPKPKKRRKYARYTCSECDRFFLDEGALRTHQDNRHPDMYRGPKDPGWPCKIKGCSARLCSKASLQLHERIHRGEKPYQCDVCGRRFADRSTVVYHQKTHNREAHYIHCDYCDFGSLRRSIVTQHMLRKHGKS